MSRVKWQWPLLIVVLGLSLALRLHALDVFLSGDEIKWICRGINFHTALARGDLRATYQTGHPGVVTMWIGTLAVPQSEIEGMQPDEDGPKDHATLTLLPPLIFRARALLAVVTWLGIIGIWWLSRGLFDERTALLGAIFIALDPFHLALSRVLHLDALLTTFMTLSVLSLLVHLKGGRGRRYLVVSAIAGGLAMANKSPGVFLAPWAALLAFAGTRAEGHTREGIWKAVEIAVLWGTVAVGTVVLIWPTLWVQPLSALSRVIGKAMGYAREPHGQSNFFWGAIRPDPGPLFYPVAWAFRTTPWVMLGLLLALPTWRSRRKRLTLLALGGFGLAYAAFMTLGAKKFDRYLLPVFPFVDLLAAGGWAELLRRWETMAKVRWQRWLPVLLTLVLVIAQFALVWPTQPYYGSYYNPLLGGARTAQKVLLVGWGEGMERAAHYLNQKANAEQFHVNTGHISQFAPLFQGHTSGLSDLDLAESDYYVFYINTIQRLRGPKVLNRFYGQVEPEKVISAQGIDYVWIYPNTLYRPALDYIEARADLPQDVLLLDVRSALVRHYDGPLPLAVVEGSMREEDIVLQLAQATAGRSRVWYLTFSEMLGDRRGVVHRHLKAQADLVERAYFEGMVVERYDLHPGAQFAVPTPSVRCDIRLGDHIRFLGYDLPRLELSRHQPLALGLYWQTSASVDTSYTAFVHLLGPDGQIWGQQDSIPQGGERPTTIWLPGETIVDHYAISLEPGAPAGDYTLAVGLYDLRTMQRLPAVDASGRWLSENCILIEGLHLPSSGE